MNALRPVSKTTWQTACAATLLLLAGTAGVAQAQVPDKVFACEVLTEAGVSGLVVAQAEDMQEAKKLVMTSSAKTMAGYDSKTRSIIQCIDARSGRFSDGTFQSFYEGLAR